MYNIERTEFYCLLFLTDRRMYNIYAIVRHLCAVVDEYNKCVYIYYFFFQKRKTVSEQFGAIEFRSDVALDRDICTVFISPSFDTVNLYSVLSSPSVYLFLVDNIYIYRLCMWFILFCIY